MNFPLFLLLWEWFCLATEAICITSHREAVIRSLNRLSFLDTVVALLRGTRCCKPYPNVPENLPSSCSLCGPTVSLDGLMALLDSVFLQPLCGWQVWDHVALVSGRTAGPASRPSLRQTQAEAPDIPGSGPVMLGSVTLSLIIG